MKYKIAFVWLGFNGVYGHWDDGLRESLRILEADGNEIKFFEPFQIGKIFEFDPDVVLYWEAPQTHDSGENGKHYQGIMNLPFKKALLFAGGQIREEWVNGFDMVFTESAINEDEFNLIGIPNMRAFGINDRIFKPEKQPKIWDACMQGTFASWKRQQLFSSALKEKGVCCGRKQKTDIEPFRQCWLNKTAIFDEMSYPNVSSLINMSHTVVNTADYWGGGQRCTLEAMACGVPVIVMSDSPKNMEYVEKSGAGIICDANEDSIRNAIARAKADHETFGKNGIEYIKNNFTAKHYADSLMNGINQICFTK